MKMDKNDPLDWWRKARFGMFIHFGLYSAMEGIWKGEEIPGLGEWAQCRARIPLKEYKKNAEKVTLEAFDAEKYVQLAKDAGMKYIVFTAKHHDGFAMYDSQYSDYSIVKMGPSGRDPAKELAEAAKKAGLTMCFYYSQALDWEDPDATGNDWDYDAEKKDFRRFLDGKCKHQLKELLTNYGDLGLIWFDVPRGISREQSIEVRDYVKHIQPNCLVSGRISYHTDIGDYGSLGDNEIPAGKLEGDWETPATLNHTWGYKGCDHNWKKPEEVIRLMAELLSKGVNYLLNIGPMASGQIPEESVYLLKEVGKWVHLNAEAVYGTKRTPFSVDFDWGKASQKGNVIYLYLFHREEHLEIFGIRNHIKKAILIGEENQEVRVEEQHNNGLDEHMVTLTIPESKNPYMDVIKLKLDGTVDVKDGLYQQAEGRIDLSAYAAELEGGKKLQQEKKVESAEREAEKDGTIHSEGIRLDKNGMISQWFDTEGKARWKFMVYKPGTYRISIATRSAKYSEWVGGHTVHVTCGGQSMKKILKADRPLPYADRFFFDDQISDVGMVTFEKPGTMGLELTMEHYNPKDAAGLCVNKILLEPAADK